MRRLGKTILFWIDERFPWTKTWKRYASEYPVPKNLNFWYCFGVLGLLVLLNQLLTGLWLTMFYTPTVESAFNSIQSIMRDVNAGWLLRYMHTTGASAFFIILYLHLFRSLLYGSYQTPRELVWLLGMFLLILAMLEACFGYLLPWGQMSYWATQVMTSLLSAVPYVGEQLMIWVRGDYQLSTVTLQRFFALHVIGIPLLILLGTFLHLVALHHVGSNNPKGQKNPPTIPLHPYYTIKDLFYCSIFLILFFSIIFFIPDLGGYFLEPLNETPANPWMTPEHIKPMWYLAPFYAMLRAVPDKLLGVIVMSAAIFIFLFLPWLDRSSVRVMRDKGRYAQIAFCGWVISVLLLGFLGLVDITSLRLIVARLCIVIYFAYFLFMPFYTHA